MDSRHHSHLLFQNILHWLPAVTSPLDVFRLLVQPDMELKWWCSKQCFRMSKFTKFTANNSQVTWQQFPPECTCPLHCEQLSSRNSPRTRVTQFSIMATSLCFQLPVLQQTATHVGCEPTYGLGASLPDFLFSPPQPSGRCTWHWFNTTASALCVHSTLLTINIRHTHAQFSLISLCSQSCTYWIFTLM